MRVNGGRREVLKSWELFFPLLLCLLCLSFLISLSLTCEILVTLFRGELRTFLSLKCMNIYAFLISSCLIFLRDDILKEMHFFKSFF